MTWKRERFTEEEFEDLDKILKLFLKLYNVPASRDSLSIVEISRLFYQGRHAEKESMIRNYLDLLISFGLINKEIKKSDHFYLLEAGKEIEYDDFDTRTNYFKDYYEKLIREEELKIQLEELESEAQVEEGRKRTHELIITYSQLGAFIIAGCSLVFSIILAFTSSSNNDLQEMKLLFEAKIDSISKIQNKRLIELEEFIQESDTID